MSTANLQELLKPRSVVLIGASERPHSVGELTLRNLLNGGFRGELLLVNPRHPSLNGRKVYPDIKSLPLTPDLAIIATPPDQVAALIAELGGRGTKAAVIITAGFAELGGRGAELQREIVAAAQSHGLRIVGPNCVGILVPHIGLNASFAQIAPPKGPIAFLSQSGAMVTAVLDWAEPRGIGFSHIVSLGDMADVDFGDLIGYLNDDDETQAIALYIEGITGAQKFMAAARSAARKKPLLALKVGRQAAGAKAARSHTGAMAGSDIVYDAALRRAGILRVDGMSEFFDGLETLAFTRPAGGDRLAIVTNGGGPGVIATDALIAAGGKLAELAPETIAKLDAILPKTWSHGNPVDMVGDAPQQDYADVVEALLQDETTDAVLVLNAPTALADPADAARAVIGAVTAPGRSVEKNVFTAWLGEYLAAPARQLLTEAKVATYETPGDAVQGFMDCVRYARFRELARGEGSTAERFEPDDVSARAAIESALASGRQWLDPDEVAAVLRAYGIPALESRSVDDADAAASAAAQLGGPVALKIRSRDITHKSDAGGVALNLNGSEEVRRAAGAMLDRVRAAHPEARLDGFLVQQMALRPGALELIVGLSIDSVFGPVVLFGQGGTAVELIADTSLELPPLDRALAQAQMARTRVWRLLQGYRNIPRSDIEAIAEVLIRVAHLAARQPAISELDINPLLADARGVLALDTRIAVTMPAST